MKICIAGDEWACGEFNFIDNKYYGVVHKGLEQYLKNDKIDVNNISFKDANNFILTSKLKTLDYSNFDFIFYFQTDPLRDCSLDKIVKLFSNIDIFKETYQTYTLNHYVLLNSLNVPIYLVGATSYVDETDLINFKNLKVLVPSFMEFLIPSLTHPKIWPSGWEQLLTTNMISVDPQLFDFICKEKLKRDVIFTNKNDELIQKYFYPDGKQPNRLAHYELYKFIKRTVFKIEEEN